MLHSKISAYKVLLTLSLSLTPTFAWSQEESTTPTIDEENDEAVLQGADQNDNVDLLPLALAPLIFDPVLLQTIELSEIDENGEPRFSTIELSSLPSISSFPPSNSLDSFPVDPSLLNSSLTQFQESILQFELEGGVYDYRLSELYLGIGNTYQQLGETRLAIDAFSEALQLSRINNGLFTEGQLPIVEELVESYLNLGDLASANTNQEYLFYVKQKIYGAATPVILNGLLEYADWNLHAASLSMGYIPNFQSLYFRTCSFNEFNFNQSVQVKNLLSAAVFAYSQAIIMQHSLEEKFNEAPSLAESIELKNSLNFSEEDFDIPDTEQKLAYTYFLQYHFDRSNIRVNAFGEAPTNYLIDSDNKGRAALERRYVYLQNSDSPALDVILALLDIADWLLFFERWSSAENLYVQAFNLMESNGIEKVKGLVYPDLPTYIPSFLSALYTRESNRLSPEEVLQYEGYIDVSFKLGRFARPNAIRIIAKSEGTNEATERTLIQKLRYSAYRLQLEDQTEYSDNTFLVRYYYTAQRPEA